MVSTDGKMNPTPFLRVAIPCLLLLAAGCASTPAQRVAGNAAFDIFPSAVQEKILNEQVDVGFTAEMVQMALGKPDQVSRRMSADGESEVWIYAVRNPRLSLGFGISGGGGSTRTGAGVGIGTNDRQSEPRVRVILKDGVVTAVEERSR